MTLAGASLVPLWSGSARITKGAERALALDLGRHVVPGDALVFSSLTRPTLEYYARRQGWMDRLAWVGSYPAGSDRNPAAVAPTPVDSALVWQEQALRLRAQWEAHDVRRVWILALRDPRLASEDPAWPSRPAPPPPARGRIDAAQVAYPANVLLSALVGLRDVPVELEYRQDWVSGERLLLRVDRDGWVSVDSIPRVETAR